MSLAVANQDDWRVDSERDGDTIVRDLGELTPREEEAVYEADDFIVWGKASIEQVDKDGTKIDVDALEESRHQLLDEATGQISRGHDDVKVGMALDEYQVTEPTTVRAGDTEVTLDEGDQIRTGKVDYADQDEFWVVANIHNKNTLARETRLGILRGDLDGFSVTIYKTRVETDDGVRFVRDLDFHGVTIGEDHQIRNEGSEFDHVEFKADLQSRISDTDDPVNTGEGLLGRMGLFSDSTSLEDATVDDLLRAADEEISGLATKATGKVEEDVDPRQAAEDVTDDLQTVDADDVLRRMDEDDETDAIDQNMISYDDLDEDAQGTVDAVAELHDVETEAAMSMVFPEEHGGVEMDGMDYNGMDEDEGETMASEEDDESIEEMVEQKLDERVDDIASEVEGTLDDVIEQKLEEETGIEQKASTGRVTTEPSDEDSTIASRILGGDE